MAGVYGRGAYQVAETGQVSLEATFGHNQVAADEAAAGEAAEQLLGQALDGADALSMAEDGFSPIRTAKVAEEDITVVGHVLRDFADKETKNWSAFFQSEGEARAFARAKLGSNPFRV